MTKNAVIGLDLGGTKLAGAIFRPNGRVVCRSIVPLAGRQGRAVGELICSELAGLLAGARGRALSVTALGLCVPGISHSDTGTVWAPNIRGWEDYPLRREIRAAVQNQRIRIAIDSDRACYILGETWRGAAKGCRNAIFLAVGTGIGAGILVDGRILRGAHDIAGAIGWLALDRPFRSKYVSCGCFEHHASGRGLAKVAKELLARRFHTQRRVRARGLPSPPPVPAGRVPARGALWPLPLEKEICRLAQRAGGRTDYGVAGLRSHKELAAQDIFAAYDRGDPLAKEVVAQAIEFWGMAVANLVSLFNPEKIIFGGGVFGPGTKLLGNIYAEAKKWAQPISIGQVKLLASRLGGDAGLYGAGCLALQAASSART